MSALSHKHKSNQLKHGLLTDLVTANNANDHVKENTLLWVEYLKRRH